MDARGSQGMEDRGKESKNQRKTWCFLVLGVWIEVDGFCFQVDMEVSKTILRGSLDSEIGHLSERSKVDEPLKAKRTLHFETVATKPNYHPKP